MKEFKDLEIGTKFEAWDESYEKITEELGCKYIDRQIQIFTGETKVLIIK